MRFVLGGWSSSSRDDDEMYYDEVFMRVAAALISNELFEGGSSSSSSSEANTDQTTITQGNVLRFLDLETSPLLGSLFLDQAYNVRIVNWEDWRIHPTFDTLHYQIVDKQVEEKYAKLESEMEEFYKGSVNSRNYALPEYLIVTRKLSLAVVQLPTGEIKRVRIVHLAEDEKWEELDAEYELASAGEEEDDDPEDAFEYHVDYAVEQRENSRVMKLSELTLDPDRSEIILADENKSLKNTEGVKFFYLFEEFAKLPFRTLELFLDGTEDFYQLNEFRDVASHYFQESPVFKCTVKTINSSRIPFVTLHLPDFFEKSFNEILCLKTVETLEKATVPPVGDFTLLATVSHIDETGDLFLQFQRTYTFKLFEKLSKKALTTKKVTAAKKAKGPFKLDPLANYVAPFDGNFYRCQIHPNDPTIVFFFDYGNYDVVKKGDLVPCEAIDEVLNAFPEQAVHARLANVQHVNAQKVNNRLFRVTYIVETLVEGKDGKPPIVELSSTFHPDRKLSEVLIKSKFAVPWESPRIGSERTYGSELVPRASIRLREINWGRMQSPVLASPGKIIVTTVKEVLIDSITIQPVEAYERIVKLRNLVISHLGCKRVGGLRPADCVEIQSGNDICKGDFCLCFSEEINRGDSLYFRVRIMSDPIRRSPPSKSTVKVLCVDYGNVGEVDMNTLLPIYSAQSVMPAQAAKLAINGYTGGPVNRNQLWKIKDFMEGRQFLLKIKNVTEDEETGLDLLEGDLYPFVPGLETVKLESFLEGHLGERVDMDSILPENETEFYD